MRCTLALFFFALSLSVFSQNADTAWANVAYQFLRETDQSAFEGVNASWKALDMEDTIPETVYTGVSDQNGVVQDSIPVCIDSTVGLAQHYKDAVRVGPIPGNEINIQLPQELAGNHRLQLYDMQGRQVASEQFTGTQEHISLDHLARGAYVFNLTRDGEQVFSGKTIKVDVPVQGMQSYQPKSKKQEGLQKDLGDCEATYRIYWDAPEGWVDDSLDVTVSNSEPNNYDILVHPWDTAYA
ncbi:MAG: T9SS type A sorting domain-containing protein, partial [Flavobacteriales bacterium]|nr:T9SS type A sorting domain-containing protein [Flavobacteriales bacterium]